MFKNKLIFFLILTILFPYDLETRIIDHQLQAVNGEYDINFSKESQLGYGEVQLLSFRNKEGLFDKLDIKISLANSSIGCGYQFNNHGDLEVNQLTSPCSLSFHKGDNHKIEINGVNFDSDIIILTFKIKGPFEKIPTKHEDENTTEFKEEFLLTFQLGTTDAVGFNLADSLDSGLSLGLNIRTPFSFSINGKDIKLSAGLQYINLPSKNMLEYDYDVTNIGLYANTTFAMLDFSLGVGLSLSSGQTIDVIENNEHQEYEFQDPYFSVALLYQLPLSFALENLSIYIFCEAIEIFNAPTNTSSTSDLLNMGVSLKYPVLF